MSRLIDADEETRFANENLPDAHAGVITAFLRDCATVDPVKHEISRFYYDCYVETAKLRNRIASELVELEKCGCEHCRRLIRIFDGRSRSTVK